MLRYLARAGLVASLVFHTLGAQTITVTELRSVCSALNYLPTTTVTPTITVLPPISASGAGQNSHAFLIRLEQTSSDSYGQSAAAPVYVAASGGSTSNQADAASFRLVNGQLYLTGTGLIGTKSDVSSELFPAGAPSSSTKITTTFSLSGGMLVWRNDAFANGVAQFYLITVNGKLQLHVSFSGQMPSNSVPVTLVPQPVASSATSVTSGRSQSATLAGSGSSSQTLGSQSGLSSSPVSSSLGMSRSVTGLSIGSINGGPGPASIASPSSTNPSVTFTSASAGMGSPTIVTSMTTPSTASPYPTSSGPTASALSSSVVVTTGIGAGSSSILSSLEGTSSSSSFVPAGTPVPAPASCPSDSGKTVEDSNGIYYVLGCSYDSTPDATGQGTASNSFNDCFDLCDAFTGCVGWTYVGQPNGIGAGACYFKTGPTVLVPGEPSYVAAYRLSPGAGQTPSSSSLSTSTAGSSSSGASGSTLTAASISSSSSLTATSSGSSASSVSSSSSSTTLAAGQPTACTFGDPAGTDQDDAFCEIDLPFQMQMYSLSDTKTFASVNGILSLSNGSAAYDGGALPDTSLPPSTACPYFDDLYLAGSRSTNESITYFTTATSVNYTYTLSRPGNYESYIFSVYYTTSSPGIFSYSYAVVGRNQAQGTQTSNGSLASVGIQGVNTAGQQVAIQYSYEQAVIAPGLVITCDTILHTCTGSDGTVVVGS